MGFLKCSMSSCSTVNQRESERKEYRGILQNRALLNTSSHLLLNPQISYVHPFLFWNLLFLKKTHCFGKGVKCPECSWWQCVQKVFPKASEAAVRWSLHPELSDPEIPAHSLRLPDVCCCCLSCSSISLRGNGLDQKTDPAKNQPDYK